MSQVLRDSVRSKMHHALLRHAQDLLLGVQSPALTAARDRGLAALDDARGAMDGLLRGDPREAGYHVRGLVTRMARVVQVALLLDDAQHARAEDEVDWLPDAARFLLDRFVTPGYDPREDPAYPALIDRLMSRGDS